MSNAPRPDLPASQEPTPGPKSQKLIKEPVAPRQIGWAVRLLQLAAGLQVFVTLLAVLNILSPDFRARTLEAVTELGQDGLLDSIVDTAVKFSLVSALAGGIFLIGIYWLLAKFIGKGALWARLAGGVVAIGSLYQLNSLAMPGGLVAIVQMLAALTAITLCYIKPASTYFREKQIAALQRKYR